MEIKKFITSTNDIDTYYQFCGAVCENIKDKFGPDIEIVIGYVTDRDESDKRFKALQNHATIIRFDPIDGIDVGNQAKVTRMYLASTFDEPVALLDIDMFVINDEFLKLCFSYCGPDKLGVIGANVYYNTADHGKFPMYYTHGMGSTFQKIVNPKNLEYEALLRTWDKEVIDGKENIFNPFEKFSDESLLRSLIIQTNMQQNVTNIDRPDVAGPHRFAGRIDRGWWGYDQEKLENNYYLDCNPLRPFNDNVDQMKSLLDYLNIDATRVFIP